MTTFFGLCALCELCVGFSVRFPWQVAAMRTQAAGARAAAQESGIRYNRQ
jgi:hypothetical protein